jgi:FkbM family methyltransferase
MKNLISEFALWLHVQHRDLYSYYKVRMSNQSFDQPLDAIERLFYLELQSLLKNEPLVIYDIGAAEGILSSALAKLANSISIQAFEPIPDVYQKLSIKTSRFSKISCHNVALGDAEGKISMYISNKSNSSSLLPMKNLHNNEFPGTGISHKIDVPVVRLDDYVRQNNLLIPNLIKIDVQGYEKNVIEGGLETISKSKYCVVEMSFKSLYEGSPLFDDIYNILKNLGFKIIGVSHPLKGHSSDQLQVDGYFENINI